MDFTNDACMNLFTIGQKQRMLSFFNEGGPRNLMLSSKGLNPPWNMESPAEIPANAVFKFYPNPTTGELILNFEYNTNWVGKPILIVNVEGIVVAKTQINSKVQSINLSQLKPGVYFIQAENSNQKLREKFIKL
jgi:hypothetical protein